MYSIFCDINLLYVGLRYFLRMYTIYIKKLNCSISIEFLS